MNESPDLPVPSTTEPPTTPRRIVRYESENVKRIRAVHVEPHGSIVSVVGDNGQGKSSLIDAIEYAIAGARSHPPEVVRRGERRARVVLDLAPFPGEEPDLRITRRWTLKGTTLDIEWIDGRHDDTPPQTLLDSLYDRLAFDLGAFMRMAPADQAARMRKWAGIDTTDLDLRRTDLLQKRRDAKRDLEARERSLATLTRVSDPGPVPSTNEIVAEIDRRQATVRANEEKRDAYRQIADTLRHSEAMIAAKREELESLRQRTLDLLAELETDTTNLGVIRAEAARQHDEVHALVDPEIQTLRAQLESIDSVRARRLQFEAVQTTQAAAQAAGKTYDDLGVAIDDLDEERHQRLQAASFPVPGLAVDDTGPLLNGVPLEQASQAEQTIAMAALGMAMNPPLRVVLMKNGNDLDNASLARLEAWAQENNVQVWIEMVRAANGKATVQIYDGEEVGDVGESSAE